MTVFLDLPHVPRPQSALSLGNTHGHTWFGVTRQTGQTQLVFCHECMYRQWGLRLWGSLATTLTCNVSCDRNRYHVSAACVQSVAAAKPDVTDVGTGMGSATVAPGGAGTKGQQAFTGQAPENTLHTFRRKWSPSQSPPEPHCFAPASHSAGKAQADLIMLLSGLP